LVNCELSHSTAQNGDFERMSDLESGRAKEAQNVQQQGFPRGHPP
jgi:hypothetical protein